MSQRIFIHQERQDAIHWLVEQFPAAFFSKNKQIKPLKLGIFEDILDFYERLDYAPLSKKSLREALNYYSSSKAYLSCQTEGKNRIDLFGYETEPVTKEQAAYAQKQLSERFVKKSAQEKSTNDAILQTKCLSSGEPLSTHEHLPNDEPLITSDDKSSNNSPQRMEPETPGE